MCLGFSKGADIGALYIAILGCIAGIIVGLVLGIVLRDVDNDSYGESLSILLGTDIGSFDSDLLGSMNNTWLT